MPWWCRRTSRSVGHHGAVQRRRERTTAGLAALILVATTSACAATEVRSGTDPAVTNAVSNSVSTDIGSAVTGAGGTGPVTSLDGAATPSTSAPTATSPAVPSSTAAGAEPLPTVVPLSGWDAVDQYLDVTLIRGGSAAASVAVLVDGELEHQAAYGRRVAGDPAVPTDRFRVASISKTVLAVTALELVEDGVLSLDEPVGDLLAGRLDIGAPTAGTAAITLRHLLTHRSGFPQYENLFFRNEVASCAEAARAGFSRSLQSTPGTSFQYSNMNFCVLGILIEQVTGTPYAQVAQEQVLAPLGITSMRTAGTFDLEPDDVEHDSDEGRNYMEVLGGAGAWVAAPADLVTILNSLDPTTPGSKVLEPATVEMMATITVTPPVPEPAPDPGDDAATETSAPPTTVPAPPTSGYGMGLMIFDKLPDGGIDTATFGHTGTLESTHAMFVRRPDGITWAVTISGDYPASTREIATIMDNALLLGGFADGTYTTPSAPLTGG